MARIRYDETTAAAFRRTREVSHEGLRAWRETVGRHLGTDRHETGVVLDLGAGTGAFAAAFCDWYGIKVIAVEPAAAMRSMIPLRADIAVLEGNAEAVPLPDGCVDAVWLSTVIHHIPDLDAAAREIRRVVRPGGPVLIRNAFPDRYERIDSARWFPEVGRMINTYPSVERTRAGFSSAGFGLAALESVPQEDYATLPRLLERADEFREADTTMRSLSPEEFERGKERIRQAIAAGEDDPGVRTSWLDLLVLR